MRGPNGRRLDVLERERVYGRMNLEERMRVDSCKHLRGETVDMDTRFVCGDCGHEEAIEGGVK